jgi:hypothetical protein
MLEEVGFVDVEIGPPADVFAGGTGAENAQVYEVFGYAFLTCCARHAGGDADRAGRVTV